MVDYSTNQKDVYLLESIVEYCDNIFETMNRFGATKEALEKDLAYQYTCAFALIRIGEYVNDLSQKFIHAHPEIPWKDIVRMRHILTHAYGNSCIAAIWQTISEDVKPLRDFCAEATR